MGGREGRGGEEEEEVKEEEKKCSNFAGSIINFYGAHEKVGSGGGGEGDGSGGGREGEEKGEEGERGREKTVSEAEAEKASAEQSVEVPSYAPERCVEGVAQFLPLENTEESWGGEGSKTQMVEEPVAMETEPHPSSLGQGACVEDVTEKDIFGSTDDDMDGEWAGLLLPTQLDWHEPQVRWCAHSCTESANLILSYTMHLCRCLWG